MTDPVYLDYNATTPVAPEVADAIEPSSARGNSALAPVVGPSVAVDRMSSERT